MMPILQAASVGFVLGLSVAAQIGPVSVLAATVAVTRGFAVGACIGLGAAAADMLYAAGGLLLGDTASEVDLLVRVLTFAAGTFLIVLGVRSAQAAVAVRNDGPGPALGSGPVATSKTAAFRTGSLLALTNVQTIAFWAAVMTGTGSAAGVADGAWSVGILITGVGLGTTTWFALVSGAGAALAGRVKSLWPVQLAGGLTLVTFGVLLVFRAGTP